MLKLFTFNFQSRRFGRDPDFRHDVGTSGLPSTFYHPRSNQGFTLIEALIYIVLFSFIIGAGVASAFYLIQGTDELRREALAEAEANFVLRRIDNLLSGATEDDLDTATGKNLTVNGTTVTESGGQITYAGTDLLSGNFSVDELTFERVSEPNLPDAVTTTLILEGNTFHKIYYLR